MSAGATILVVDDEPDICNLVVNCLKVGGMCGLAAEHGPGMRSIMTNTKVDLVILDLLIGGEDGLALLRELRRETDIPVIILTGRGEPIDRVIGLELGADDYLAKPFEPRELIARVRSVLRRTASSDSKKHNARIKFSGWDLNLAARQLTAPDGSEVALTAAEFDILTELARNPNRAIDRDRLLEHTRNRQSNPYDRSIDVHVMNLRRKIESDPKTPRLIKTIRGIGYIFTPTADAL